jgi:hypothetical protein
MLIVFQEVDSCVEAVEAVGSLTMEYVLSARGLVSVREQE